MQVKLHYHPDRFLLHHYSPSIKYLLHRKFNFQSFISLPIGKVLDARALYFSLTFISRFALALKLSNAASLFIWYSLGFHPPARTVISRFFLPRRGRKYPGMNRNIVTN